MEVPLLHDHGLIPAQQAAAAAQYPMLAPRPMNPASMGYQSSSSEALLNTDLSQFQYPEPRAQAHSNLWPSQGYAQASRVAPNQIEDQEGPGDDLYQQVSNDFWKFISDMMLKLSRRPPICIVQICHNSLARPGTSFQVPIHKSST